MPVTLARALDSDKRSKLHPTKDLGIFPLGLDALRRASRLSLALREARLLALLSLIRGSLRGDKGVLIPY